MAITARPEIIPPGAEQASKPGTGTPGTGAAGTGGAFSDRNLDSLSHLLDDFIHIPGTPIRFGLDGIIGFIPGVGDVLGGAASCIIIVAAWVRGVPRAVVGRMVLNVAIETAAGSVPLLGNLFDIGWRANRRNYALLMGALHGPSAVPPKRGSWLFVAGVCLVLAGLIAVPMLLLGWLLAVMGHHLAGTDVHRF